MPAHGHFRGRGVVRWGILGCGDVTERKSGPGFQKADRSKLVAVMRRDAERARDYAERHGVGRWYTDAGSLISDPEVDAVYIATPPGSHTELALAVAEAGKPCYVEKPMARSAAECDLMVEAFERRDLPLFVAYYRRRLPCFVKAKELIDQGALGSVTGVTWRLSEAHHRRTQAWRVDAGTAGGGHFLDVGSHGLDLIDYLLGPLESVAGTAANLASPYAVEDCVHVAFTAGGVPGSVACLFASDAVEDRFQVVGTEGELLFPIFRSEPLALKRGDAVERIELPYPPHVAQPMIQSVVDDLLGGEHCPSTGVTARRTSRVMDTALSAYYGGRMDAFWERPGTWPGRRRA